MLVVFLVSHIWSYTVDGVGVVTRGVSFYSCDMKSHNVQDIDYGASTICHKLVMEVAGRTVANLKLWLLVTVHWQSHELWRLADAQSRDVCGIIL